MVSTHVTSAQAPYRHPPSSDQLPGTCPWTRADVPPKVVKFKSLSKRPPVVPSRWRNLSWYNSVAAEKTAPPQVSLAFLAVMMMTTQLRTRSSSQPPAVGCAAFASPSMALRSSPRTWERPRSPNPGAERPCPFQEPTASAMGIGSRCRVGRTTRGLPTALRSSPNIYKAQWMLK